MAPIPKVGGHRSPPPPPLASSLSPPSPSDGDGLGTGAAILVINITIVDRHRPVGCAAPREMRSPWVARIFRLHKDRFSDLFNQAEMRSLNPVEQGFICLHQITKFSKSGAVVLPVLCWAHHRLSEWRSKCLDDCPFWTSLPKPTWNGAGRMARNTNPAFFARCQSHSRMGQQTNK